MTTTVEDIIAGVEVLTTIPEWFSGGGGETKMTVLVGESGAMSIMNALDAAGFVIVSKEALKAGSDGYLGSWVIGNRQRLPALFGRGPPA
jgi:hypothetical protein